MTRRWVGWGTMLRWSVIGCVEDLVDRITEAGWRVRTSSRMLLAPVHWRSPPLGPKPGFFPWVLTYANYWPNPEGRSFLHTWKGGGCGFLSLQCSHFYSFKSTLENLLHASLGKWMPDSDSCEFNSSLWQETRSFFQGRVWTCCIKIQLLCRKCINAST